MNENRKIGIRISNGVENKNSYARFYLHRTYYKYYYLAYHVALAALHNTKRNIYENRFCFFISFQLSLIYMIRDHCIALCLYIFYSFILFSFNSVALLFRVFFRLSYLYYLCLKLTR